MLDLDALQANPTPAKPLNLRVATPAPSSKTEREVIIERQTEIQTVLTGGKEVPQNVDWTGTVIAGTVMAVGLVEFRCLNGVVQFRGSLKQSITAAGSYIKVRSFGSNWLKYAPPTDTTWPVYAVDTGTAYRWAAVAISAAGEISLSAPTGKYDTVYFGGISYPVF